MTDEIGSVVRAVMVEDEAEWKRLYREYRAFYELAPDDDAVDRTWGWVSNGEFGLSGLVVVRGGELAGLANLRRFARPSSASTGLYLDDLFTSPEHRRSGVASELIDQARRIAGAEGSTVVRWVTAADNSTARSLYDSVATATRWVTYDLPVESSSR